MPKQGVAGRSREQALVDAWQEKSERVQFPAAVWERWVAVETPGPSRDSLRTLLRRWREGGTSLKEHPGLRRAIVSVLSEVRRVTEDDLFGSHGGGRSLGSYPFHAFPALGVFDPVADEPFRAATLHRQGEPRMPGLLNSLVGGVQAVDLLDLPQGAERAWVTLPPGAGRSFAANWTRHCPRPEPSFYRLPLSSPPTVISLVTPSVEAIDTIDDGEPLLIELEAAGEELHPFVQRLLQRRAHWAVLAPFAVPLRDSKAQVYAWRVDAGWRDGYVRWVARRLELLGNRRGRLDVATFLAWVARVDPDVSRFTTPGDLLPLLDYAHTHGTETLTKQFGAVLVRSVLGATIERISGTSVRDRWLREVGVGTFTRMLETWWRTPGTRWGTKPTTETWIGLVPKETEPAFTEARERARTVADALQVSRLTKARRDGLIAELGEVFTNEVPAREAVRALMGARVLRDVGVGVLDVSPRWLAEAMAKDVVQQSLAKDATSVWGRWCVDPARRPLVDERLLAYGAPALVALVAQAVKGFDPASLGAVGAVETLFATVGERLASEGPLVVNDREPLMSLARLQVGLLAPHYTNGLPAPRTRVGPSEATPGGARFVAACWAWSLRTAAPPDKLPPGSTWLFPGWAAPSVDDIPDALQFHDQAHPGGPDGHAEARGIELMHQLLPEVLGRATGTFERVGRSHDIPRNLAVAAIPLAIRREWPMAVLTSAIRSPSLDEAQRLARSIDALPADLCGQTIDALWDVALGERRTVLAALRYFDPDRSPEELPRSPLVMLLRRRFPVERIEAAVKSASPWDGRSEEHLLRLVPEEHRVRIARALVAAPASSISHSVDMLKAFGRELVEVLLEIAALPKGCVAAQAVWEIAPEVARAHAEADYARGQIAPWISSMPQERLGELVEVVEQFRAHPVPDELRLWLSGRLAVVGPEAERLWALLQRAGWPPCVEAERPR